MPTYKPERPLNLYAMDRMARIKVLMCAPSTCWRRYYSIQAPPHLELDAVLEAVRELLWLEGIGCQILGRTKRRAHVRVDWRYQPQGRAFTFKELVVPDDNLEAFLAELDT